MEERCENCKFYSELRIHKRYAKQIDNRSVLNEWTVGEKRSQWDGTHCCLMFVKTENEPYVLEVYPDDRCEMFCEKND